MDPRFQQSAFIPKGPSTQSPLKVHGPVNLFSVFSIVIFIVSIGLTGGVFFINKLEADKVKAKTDELTKRNTELKADGTIPNLLRLDERIQAAKEILNKHVALSQILGVLESITSQNVQYVSMDMAFKGDIPTISITGKATSLNSVAFQSDIYRKSKKEFNNPIFSGLNLDKDGTSFSLDVTMNRDVPLYKNKAEFAEQTKNTEAATPTREGGVTPGSPANPFTN